MTLRTAERRRHVREAASYAATLHNGSGRVLARGRTVNISESGVLVVARGPLRVPSSGQVYAELTIPANPDLGTTRRVCYLCRVVRTMDMADMTGLGLEFVEKVA